MQIQISEGNIDTDDAQKLLCALSETLSEITGDTGQNSFDDFDKQNPRNLFLLARFDNQNVGCVALREIDFETCELKRMYSNGIIKGIGQRLLDEAEGRAIILGYSRIILSTRKINFSAVNFYLKNGFIEIEPYGQYINYPQGVSICMEKNI